VLDGEQNRVAGCCAAGNAIHGSAGAGASATSRRRRAQGMRGTKIRAGEWQVDGAAYRAEYSLLPRCKFWFLLHKLNCYASNEQRKMSASNLRLIHANAVHLVRSSVTSGVSLEKTEKLKRLRSIAREAVSSRIVNRVALSVQSVRRLGVYLTSMLRVNRVALELGSPVATFYQKS
jgi:hypothetical protein